MADTVRIRRAAVAEATAITELVLRSKAMWGYDADFMAKCREELTVRPSFIEAGEVWVAEAGGTIVGMVGLWPRVHGDDRSAELHMIFVDPGAVRSGVGRALWRHAEARARALGAKALALDSDPYAVGFYERMGMRIVGESPSGSIPGRMLPRMAKSLAEALPNCAAG
ncbi:MAG: GNAT family N-acetyltransferase [Propylenella sp.]